MKDYKIFSLIEEFQGEWFASTIEKWFVTLDSQAFFNKQSNFISIRA